MACFSSELPGFAVAGQLGQDSDFRDRDGLGLRYLLGYLAGPSAYRALPASRRSIVRIAVTAMGPSSPSGT